MDCAGMGDDNTVAKVRKGSVELDCGFELSKAEEQTVLEKLENLINYLQDKYKKEIDGIKVLPEVVINVDTTGIGYGVGSQLRTKIDRGHLTNVTCNSIAFGGKAKNDDRYFNVVTEMYFEFSNLIKSRLVKMSKCIDTINESCSRKYSIEESKNRRKIEEKSKCKKRIVKSPDKADALVMAFYVPKKPLEAKITILEW
jgi:ribosome-associated translation inhibitor RaiA